MDNEAGSAAAGVSAGVLRQGTWSLDLQQWRVHWSPQARAIHDVEGGNAPTVWEALEYVDPPDRARLFEAALRLGREGMAPGFRIAVSLTSARGRRRRVVITGFRTAPQGDHASIKGTIAELSPAPEAVPQENSAASGAANALREWEVFAAALPHELKSPVAIARGLAQAVRDAEPGLSALGASRLERVTQRLGQLECLLDALLALAPSESALRKAPVNLSTIATEVLADLRELQPHRAVRCTVQSDLWVAGDEGLLRIALANLLRNAWKFTEGVASPQVTVRAERRGHVDGVCVEDNGIGFDMADASRLFLPFQRLHDGRFEGSGLGLTLARRVLERHGGSIWAESSPGAGARFVFTLPQAVRGAGSRDGAQSALP